MSWLHFLELGCSLYEGGKQSVPWHASDQAQNQKRKLETVIAVTPHLPDCSTRMKVHMPDP